MGKLSSLSEDSVEGRLAGDVFAAIGKKWHDLARRKVSVLGAVRRREDQCALLGAQLV
jgi:hypothetical protein